MSDDALRVGISACLLGDEVRWDGGHKRASWLAEFPPVEWVPICPEVEIGLGVPRPPIQLVREESITRLREVESGRDLTDAMARWAGERLPGLRDLDGYVLKSRSPTCGLRGVSVEGAAAGGRGLFADALVRAHPELPVVEETDLATAAGRERFLARARSHRRARAGR